MAEARAGKVTLDRAKIGWRLPPGTGAVKRLGVPDKTTFNNLGKYAKTLFEFPVKGDADLQIGKGETATIDTNVGMPALLGGVSGAVTLHTTSAGLVLNGLKIHVPDAELGLLRISNVNVSYSGSDSFTGSATLKLPPAYGGSFTAGFGFKHGRLNYVHYDQPFNPMLPIVAPPVIGTPPQPLVGLKSLGIDYVDTPASRRFVGHVVIVGGGEYFGYRAATLNGNVTLDFPAGKPATISAGGDLTVVIVPFASAKVAYRTDGLFSFDGHFGFPPPGMWQSIAGFTGDVDGWVSVANPIRFSASGKASAHVGPVVGGGQTVMSSQGISGCVSFPQPPSPFDPIPDLGVSYKWGDSFPKPELQGRRLQAREAGARRSECRGRTGRDDPRRHAAGGARDQRRGRGAAGQGHRPRRQHDHQRRPHHPLRPLHRPGVPAGRQDVRADREAPGRRVFGRRAARLGPGADGQARPGPAPAEGQGQAFRPRPQAASAIPDPQGRRPEGHVCRAVRRRPLSRTGLHAKGQGEARLPPEGLLAAAPSDHRPGRAERRPAGAAAGCALPSAEAARGGEAAAPAVGRKGHKLVARWRRVRGARGYRVEIVLPKDGRHLIRFLKPKRTKATLRGLEADDKGKVRVQAVAADGRSGRTATAKLKPKRRHKHKHHKGRGHRHHRHRR